MFELDTLRARHRGGTLSRCESRGPRHPCSSVSLALALAIAHALDATVEELFGCEELR